ncbi:MAG: EamA family transporter [Proteobacteria bacterium]|nr:EamA family transporter [Pseudomonadota bacterium]
MQSAKTAKFYLIFTAILWSLGGVLIKWVDFSPLIVSGLRSLVAGVFLFLYFRPKLLPLNCPVFFGSLTYALTVIAFVIATKWTTAASAILLQSTAPLYVAFFGIFYLNEKIQIKDSLILVLVALGMLLFFKDNISLENFKGNLFGLFSGFCFAWFILITRKSGSENTIQMIVLGNFLASIMSLSWAWPLGDLNYQGLGGVFVLGVFQLALPYALYSKAISHVSALETSLIALIEPILNPIWVYLILAEKPGPWAIVGGIIVIASVAFRSFILNRTTRRL